MRCFPVAVIGGGTGPFETFENIIGRISQQAFRQSELGVRGARSGGAAQPVDGFFRVAIVDKAARQPHLRVQIAG